MRSIAVISVLCCLALVHSRDSASLSDKLEDLEKSKSKTSERTANRVDSIKMHAKSESERFYMYINSATKKLSEIKRYVSVLSGALGSPCLLYHILQ